MPKIKDFITPNTIRFAELMFTQLVDYAMAQAAEIGQPITRAEAMEAMVDQFRSSAEARTTFDAILEKHRETFGGG